MKSKKLFILALLGAQAIHAADPQDKPILRWTSEYSETVCLIPHFHPSQDILVLQKFDWWGNCSLECYDLTDPLDPTLIAVHPKQDSYNLTKLSEITFRRDGALLFADFAKDSNILSMIDLSNDVVLFDESFESPIRLASFSTCRHFLLVQLQGSRNLILINTSTSEVHETIDFFNEPNDYALAGISIDEQLHIFWKNPSRGTLWHTLLIENGTEKSFDIIVIDSFNSKNNSYFCPGMASFNGYLCCPLLEHKIHIYDMLNQEIKAQFENHLAPRTQALNTEGSLIALSFGGYGTQVHNVATGKKVCSLKKYRDRHNTYSSTKDGVRKLAFNHDSSLLARCLSSGGSRTHILELWDIGFIHTTEDSAASIPSYSSNPEDKS